MPIINEIDEQHPENNRTIDTDTGVYLKVIKANGHERVAEYQLVDDTTTVYISAFFSNQLNDELKINDYSFMSSIHYRYCASQVMQPLAAHISSCSHSNDQHPSLTCT